MSLGGQFSGAADPAPAVIIGHFAMSGGSWFAAHSHPDHQLAWSDSGLVRVRTAAGTWLIPPSLGLWIPAGVRHVTAAVGSAVMRAPYVAPEGCPVQWREPTVVRVNPLLRALIGHLERTDLTPQARRRAVAVLFDALIPVSVAGIGVTSPGDRRAGTVAQALWADPADGRSLEEWSKEAGASARTLARIFVAETGLTFGVWRERLRMQRAMPLLAEGRTVESVAHRVGYMSASSFVAAFHRIVGMPPRRYFRSAGSEASPSSPAWESSEPWCARQECAQGADAEVLVGQPVSAYAELDGDERDEAAEASGEEAPADGVVRAGLGAVAAHEE